MATYVNDLRLKEISTGDESGTWGTSTNTNLELVAEGFARGTKDCFSSDADATETMADGATDEIRKLYLKVTSSATLSATRTLTLGPNTVSKVWIIENSTSGSQAINISQGSGANVQIPNGAVKVVATDGAGSGAAVYDLSLVDLSGTQTLTNKSIDSDNNTITNLVNADIKSGAAIDAAKIANGSVSSAEFQYLDGVTSAIQTQIDTKTTLAAALAGVYPVGSIYVNATSSTNPSSLLGFGTWEAFGAGRVIVGSGGSFSGTGGASTVTLSTNELPAHDHSFSASFSGTTDAGTATIITGKFPNYSADNFTAGRNTLEEAALSGNTATFTSSHTHGFSGSVSGDTGSKGSGSSFSIMNPYIVVYMWKRTA